MENYEHYGETRRGETEEATGKVGPCLTCRYWQTDEQRTPNLSGSIMQCVQPELKSFHLMVSGASGCNRWESVPDMTAQKSVPIAEGAMDTLIAPE